MNKRYTAYVVTILILVLSFGIMVKRAVSDVVVNNMRAEFSSAMKDGDVDRLLKCVETENPLALRDGINKLNPRDREKWAQIFDKANLVDQTPTQRTYQTYGIFDGIAVTMDYTIKLHQNGQWKIDTGSSLSYLQ